MSRLSKKRTFLVTGGLGFIGSHFVERCLSMGHKVINIDKMTYASNQKLPWDDDENYTLIKEDIGKLTHLPLCDIIVNFAAESHVDRSATSSRTRASSIAPTRSSRCAWSIGITI